MTLVIIPSTAVQLTNKKALRTKTQPPAIHYRIAAQQHGPMIPQRIVLHDTESPNVQGGRDVTGIPEFWQRQGLGYGSHLVMDQQGLTCRCVYDHRIAWHVGGHNTGSLGIEQIGYASYTTADWDKGIVGLKQAAKWCAHWSIEYNIPIRANVQRGICTHRMMSIAYPGDTNHTDPGRNYPLDHVLDLARYYVKHGWLVQPNA